MAIELLRKALEDSIDCNGINNPITIELRNRLEKEINKEQKAIYEKYRDKNIL
ncbi:hypothetical protein [Clostridium sp. D53t1_180928_C8]|uniref:hypothetical protein n=1 Tax=Clostridium sp. D53t1_180928_C8 TaxID=2787101 RepID=UPI0018ABC7AD|nr:hypothetical protein [Clostridium sp. D53t1_180928_C8]